jgi:hypothetical protein
MTTGGRRWNAQKCRFWSLISMIAYTILAVTTARSSAVIPASAEAKLIPLTLRELLTLLRASVLTPARTGSRPRPALFTVATPSPAPSRRMPPPLERSHRSGNHMTTAIRS